MTATMPPNENGRPRATPDDFKNWHRFDMGGHPDYVTYDSLDIHVIWCIWHEGLPYYRDGSAMKIDALRESCVTYQWKNGAAKSMIENATNNELRAVLQSMKVYFDTPVNGGYQMLCKHLGWVLIHEGQRRRVLELLDQSAFGEIRSIYRHEQEHNPHVAHLIEAASDAAIRNLLDDMRL